MGRDFAISREHSDALWSEIADLIDPNEELED